MAFDRRLEELRTQLAAAMPADDPRHATIAKALVSYAELRNAALDDLVALIDELSVGATGTQARWLERADRARAELDRHFGDCAKDLLMPAPLQMFWFMVVEHERAFFKGLGGARTPQYVEDLLRYQGVLARMIADLQTNWNDLLSANGSLVTEQAGQVQQLDRLLQDLIRDLEAQHRAIVSEYADRLQDWMKEKAEQIRNAVRAKIDDKATDIGEGILKLAVAAIKEKLPGNADKVFDDLAPYVQIYVGKLAAFSGGYRALASEYQRLMSIEKGGVLTMFKSTRTQVAEYEKNNNLTTAQITHDEAKRFLNEWAYGAVGAQRDDAAEFNTRVFAAIDRHWRTMREMADQFASRFAGVFTAPLTNDTLETLTAKYMFRQAIDNVEWRGAAARVDDEIDALAESVPGLVDKASYPLESMSIDWPKELREAASLSNVEFVTFAREQLKSQIDGALHELAELRRQLDPARIEAEFNREELDRLLNGN